MKNMEKKELNDETFRITSPSAFLDIFFSKDKTAKRISARERKNALAKLLRILAALLAILMIVGFVRQNIAKSSGHRLKTLMEEKRHSEYLSSADQMLAQYPENRDLREAAANILLRDILDQGWIVKLNNALFTDARSILANAAGQSRHNPDGLKIVKLLHWITDIEAYFSGRKPEMLLTIFRDEIQIESLLKRWNSDKTDIRHVFKQIMLQNQSELLQNSVYSHLDMLQTQKILYFEVIQNLKNSIEAKLDADHLSPVSVIDEFEHKYPGLGGIKELREDSSNYIRLRQKIRSEQWSEIPELLNKLEFQTGFFTDKVGRLLEGKEMMHISSDFGHTRQGVVLLAKLKLLSSKNPVPSEKNRVLSESAEKGH